MFWFESVLTIRVLTQSLSETQLQCITTIGVEMGWGKTLLRLIGAKLDDKYWLRIPFQPQLKKLERVVIMESARGKLENGGLKCNDDPVEMAPWSGPWGGPWSGRKRLIEVVFGDEYEV